MSPSGSTHDASAAAISPPDAPGPAASWSEGADTVLAVDADQQATANTAAKKITAPSGHWECPAPGTTGANLIAFHSMATGLYAFGSGLLMYYTVDAARASIAALNSSPVAAGARRDEAIICGIVAGVLVICGLAWSLKCLKPGIEQAMIRRHD